jgi:hypothetical protein
MQFSPFSYYFIPLWSNYSPQHPVLKHPQSVYVTNRTVCKLTWAGQFVTLKPTYGSGFFIMASAEWLKIWTLGIRARDHSKVPQLMKSIKEKCNLKLYGFSRVACNRASLPSSHFRSSNNSNNNNQKHFQGCLMENYEPIRQKN